MKISLFRFFAFTLLIALVPTAHAESPVKDLSLRNEVDHAVHQSLTLLAEEQNLDGYWASPDYPGLTALIVRSFLDSPVDNERWSKSEAVAKGIAFILDNVKEDGGIYNRGLYSYNTAISLMCLNVYAEAAEKYGLLTEEELSDLKEIMVRAREFVVGQQQFYSEKDFEKFSGGIGYGNSYKHSDLSNTSLAIQALHETRHLVDENDEQAVELNWDAAIQFLSNTQNLPETNKQAWASGDAENRGGFVYYPGDSKAGTFEKADGVTGHRSYGSMSYAGLMSLLYAGVDKDDERVVAAVDWLKSHFNLEENPNMGLEGLYYYFHTMAKALDAYGEDTLTLDDGTEIDWAKVLAERFVSLHKHPGFWVNENSRWMESNPYLVSAYTLLALDYIYPRL
ncbi:cycloartenol synthase [Coraliomargarita sinensis]|uniref:Cycloartenol synthase n=1 Tax=Coraliomargarita sinensis TaxID=2174842 RepID=A0A317ZHY6_9BACT|nr:cycloartenol synthase [Coraliomargarita sinensis]PXA03379.1 cycloartenol synthase [Coraliomargarita sinensis]